MPISASPLATTSPTGRPMASTVLSFISHGKAEALKQRGHIKAARTLTVARSILRAPQNGLERLDAAEISGTGAPARTINPTIERTMSVAIAGRDLARSATSASSSDRGSKRNIESRAVLDLLLLDGV